MTAAGRYHSIVLKRDGSLVIWGCKGAKNVVDFGQCAYPDPCAVLNGGCSEHATCTNARGIASCVCKSGFVGDGKTCYRTANTVFKQVASFGLNSLGVMDDGTVRAWGTYAAEDMPTAHAYETPKPPAGLSNVARVATGLRHSLALVKDGTVVGWGMGSPRDYGASEVPQLAEKAIAIYAGQFSSAALLISGTLRVWGEPAAKEKLDGLTNVVRFGAGYSHALVAFENGTVTSIGWNGLELDPLLQQVPAGITTRNVKQLVAGRQHSAALFADGTVRVRGHNEGSQLSAPSYLRNVKQITARLNTTSCVLNSGELVEFPSDWDSDQDYVVPSLGSPGVASVSAGDYHRTVLMKDRSMRAYCRRYNIEHEEGCRNLPDPCEINGQGCGVNAVCSNISSVAVCICKPGFRGDGKTCTEDPGSKVVQVVGTTVAGLALLKADETVRFLTDQSSSLSGLKGVKRLVSWDSVDGPAALMGDGTLRGVTPEADADIPLSLADVVKSSFGTALLKNGSLIYFHRAKDAYWSSKMIPPAGLDATIRDFDSSGFHTVAALTNGSCIAWGGDSGNLLNTLPRGEVQGCRQVSAGTTHNLALLDNGTVLAFGGRNSYQELSVPPDLNGVVQVLAGDKCSFAVLDDGRVVSWGATGFAWCNTTMLSNVKQIASCTWCTVALHNDGTITAFGKSAPVIPPDLGRNL